MEPRFNNGSKTSISVGRREEREEKRKSDQEAETKSLLPKSYLSRIQLRSSLEPFPPLHQLEKPQLSFQADRMEGREEIRIRRAPLVTWDLR